jgi:signal transduction histidine kinase/ActR/RegA family two-component response regulator
MAAAPLPPDEAERLRALDRYGILDSPAEADFDDLTAIAAAVCGTPIALLTLVDRDRQWFKSRHGLDVAQTGRDEAFCAHAILQAGLFEVPDTGRDARFVDNPLVTGAPGIRSYAGMPLEAPDGRRLGTLCVIDRQPRALTPLQQDVLRRLARQAVAQLEVRRRARREVTLMQAVAAVQQALIDGVSLDAILDLALQRAIALTGAAQGLVADIHGGQGAEYLTARASFSVSWTPEEHERQRQRLASGVRWRTLPPAVRSAIASARPVRCTGDDARRVGAMLLESSAPTTALVLLPVISAGRPLALVALADPCGSDDAEGELAPLLAACGEAIASQRQADARRQTEHTLEQERRRLRLALLASSVGVFELDVASGELTWDWRMWDMHGVEPRTTGWSLADWVLLLHPEDADRAVDEFVASTGTQQLLEAQYRIVRPDGRVRHLRAHGQVFESDGRQLLLGVALDVTGDVQLQHDLNQARLEAESATAAKGQFLATMSHEIRTPMNGVLGMLELLLRSDLSPEQRDTAAMAHGSAEALLHILNDILDLSKLEAQQVVLESIAFEPVRLVGDTLALLSPRALEKHLALASEVDPAVPPWLEADPTRIRQVLINLVGNAVKFTARGEIRVRLRLSGPHDSLLRVEVEDTGEGIAPEARERLFTRFAQAEVSTTRRHGGTGLGLSICRQLVELMGGDIGVESTPGEGSLFWFTVPARAAATPERPVDVASPVLAALAPQLPLRVLVAEDNPVNQRLVRAFLAPGRHEVVVVGDGAAALAALDADTFDVVLMDVQMPGVDGIEATTSIRARSTPDRHVPIIALTANAMAGERERYLAVGFTDYVSKPVSMRSLADALARVCAREGQARRDA